MQLKVKCPSREGEKGARLMRPRSIYTSHFSFPNMSSAPEFGAKVCKVSYWQVLNYSCSVCSWKEVWGGAVIRATHNYGHLLPSYQMWTPPQHPLPLAHKCPLQPVVMEWPQAEDKLRLQAQYLALEGAGGSLELLFSLLCSPLPSHPQPAPPRARKASACRAATVSPFHLMRTHTSASHCAGSPREG